MKNKKKEIKKMIYSGFKDLSPNDIRRLIDKEISKDESEIDINYLDTCFELLELKENQVNDTSKRIKLKKSAKVLIIAAVFVTVLVSTITVTAKLHHFEVSDKIVSVCEDVFVVNFNHEEYEKDNNYKNENGINAFVEQYGFENVILPDEFNNSEYKIDDIQFETEESGKILIISISNSDCKLSITVKQTSSEIWLNKTREIQRDYDLAQQLDICDTDVIVFSSNTYNTINYQKGLTEYWVEIENCTFDEAVEIAKTIK